MTVRNNVCIIGAGVAGLAAANKLKTKGYNVTLLEGRNYVGGRIKIDYSLGISFPMGAAFIHGDNNDFIHQLIKKFYPKLYDFNKAPFTIFKENKGLYTEMDISKSKDCFEQILKKNRLLMSSESHDMTLLASVSDILKDNTFQISETELHWELLYLSLFTGAEAKHLSAKHWDQMGDFNGDYLLLSSYEPLINELAKDQNIQLNTTVTRIEYGNGNVKIETNKGIFEAEKALITVPLGVLKSNQILFSPNLPEIKQSAIHNLKMSRLTKIGLLFPYQFWPEDTVLFGYNSSSLNSIPFFINYSYFYGKPILLGAVSGETALECENLSKEAFIDRTLCTLRELFGNNVPKPVTAVTTNWVTDPFSQGSYSYIPVGGSGNDFDILAESIDDKIFFAGEATYRKCHSTVQGAYLSGVREADKILNLE